MSKLKDEITWGEVSVIVTCIALMVTATVYVSEAKADAKVIAAAVILQASENKEKFQAVEKQQDQQDLRMDRIVDLQEKSIRNTAILAALFKERTGRDVPQELIQSELK